MREISDPGRQGALAGDDHYLKRELYALLSEDSRLFDFIENGSLDGVWYWDLEDPDHEWMSPGFWRALGYDPSAMPHRASAWRDVVFPEDLERAAANLRRHCADPARPYDQVVRYRHADGSTVWIRCRGLAIRDAGGRPVRMLGAHNDLTEVKAAEERARADALIAETASDELRQFAYAMSHDLKSPANSLEMILGAMRADHWESLDDDARHLLEVARATVGRMRALVEDTLRFTRIVGDEARPAPFDVAAMIAEQRDAFAHDVARLGGRLEIDAPAGLFRGHRWQIGLLVQNLIENAIKYARPGVPPDISVAARFQDGAPPFRKALTLAVRDNGVGIGAAHRERVFRMFERLHAREDVPGTGLGLAICQRVARRHAGSMDVVSEPGVGSTFTATLREPTE